MRMDKELGKETSDEMKAWIGQGITIDVHKSGPGNPHYTARIDEFGLESEGNTLDDAVASLSAKLTAYIDAFVKASQPPPRKSRIHTEGGHSGEVNGR